LRAHNVIYAAFAGLAARLVEIPPAVLSSPSKRSTEEEQQQQQQIALLCFLEEGKRKRVGSYWHPALLRKARACFLSHYCTYIYLLFVHGMVHAFSEAFGESQVVKVFQKIIHHQQEREASWAETVWRCIWLRLWLGIRGFVQGIWMGCDPTRIMGCFFSSSFGLRCLGRFARGRAAWLLVGSVGEGGNPRGPMML
jgi:hypothetical protein